LIDTRHGRRKEIVPFGVGYDSILKTRRASEITLRRKLDVISSWSDVTILFICVHTVNCCFLILNGAILKINFFMKKNIFHRHGRNVGTMLGGIVSRLGGLTLRAMPPTLPIVGCGSSSYIGD